MELSIEDFRKTGNRIGVSVGVHLLVLDELRCPACPEKRLTSLGVEIHIGWHKHKEGLCGYDDMEG